MHGWPLAAAPNPSSERTLGSARSPRAQTARTCRLFTNHEMPNPDSPSAEKQLIARSPDGDEWELKVRIWPPQPVEIAPWACKVEVTRLFTPPKSVYGQDSWQAQVLAMHFAASLLQDFVGQGGSLYWPSESGERIREPFELADLLPSRKE